MKLQHVDVLVKMKHMGLSVQIGFFFSFLFYEWEHTTGTLCPFSSQHPLRKGNVMKRKQISKKGNKEKACHLVPKVVIDLLFEVSWKYRRERVLKAGSRGEETITKPINSRIGEFHTVVVGKCCLPCGMWQSHWRWNTGGQFIRAVIKVIAIEEIEKPPCGEETEGQASRSPRATGGATARLRSSGNHSFCGQSGATQVRRVPLQEQFVEYTADQGEWRERISLETIPRREKGIHPRRHTIVQGGEIHGETIVEGGGKEVDHHWPPLPQLTDHLLSQGPLLTYIWS